MPLGQDLAPYLPFLRRYARSLTSSQTLGDAYVRATMEAIAAAPRDFPRDVDPRLGLYRTFHLIWSSSNAPVASDQNGIDDEVEGVALNRLAYIPARSRQALLLIAMEGFTVADAAYLIGGDPAEVDKLVADALSEIERQTHTDVLIIEDEPIIAMDLQTIVCDLGHAVAGVATTRGDAVQKAL